MKRGLSTILATATLAWASVSGAAAAEKYYKMATLAPGSTVYEVMTSFAQLTNEAFPDIEIQVNATGAGTRHLLDGTRNELDFFVTGPMLTHLMKNKLAMYAKIDDADTLIENQRTLFNYPLGQYHIVTYAEDGINSLHDLRGKRVFAGPPAGGATRMTLNLIKAVTGMEPDKDFTQVSLSWGAAAQAFQDHQIDVYVNPTNWPSPAIAQVALSNEIRLLGLSKTDQENPDVVKLYDRPGGALDTIPADAYGENQVNEEGVVTLAAVIGLATNKWMDDETAYMITRNFFTRIRELEKDRPWLRHVREETAFNQLNAKLHPGAIRYYEEVGVAVPDEFRP